MTTSTAKGPGLERAGLEPALTPRTQVYLERIERRWLPAWFGLVSGLTVLMEVERGVWLFDAQLYLAATRAWLAGGDPWSVSLHGFLFAAPPPTLLPLAPFTLLPPPLDWLALGGVGLAGAVATVRLLRLPWWWLLFPPTVQGAMSGNVQLLLVPLILAGGGWLAGLLKVYAVVPLIVLGRWRQLAGLGVALAVTIPLLPWRAFVTALPEISATLARQTTYGTPLWLIPPAIVALILIGRERAAWLAVPALWPSQQWYYHTLAIPAGSLAAAIAAFPLAGSGAYAAIAVAIVTLWRGRTHRELS